MGNPDRKAEEKRQKDWARQEQQKMTDLVAMYTIPTHFRIKALRVAMWGLDIIQELTPHSQYLSHMLMREEMRRQTYHPS